MRMIKMRKILFIILVAGSFNIIYRALRTLSSPDLVDEDGYYVHSGSISTLRNIPVIPLPEKVELKETKWFLSNNFSLVTKRESSKNLQRMLTRYSKYISAVTALAIKVKLNASASPDALLIDCAALADHYPQLGEDESYTLNVTTTGVHLSAATLTGISRGLATFVQLIERDASSETSVVPCVSIVDKPRFAWRGVMLDVARHWMPVSVIERTLNAMELGKLNVLHLHLSDDQGFRVESVVYPLLHDRKDFFSQKDIRHLVKYAKARRIRLVPEFDIPGHTTSWFVGYPKLATEPGPYEVETSWGVMKPTMDPTKARTYTFLDRLFKEMTQLFPDPHFHIGGDEVEGSQWSESVSIQKFMTKQNLESHRDLQAHFNRRVQAMLKKYGKMMIGWEEILGDLPMKPNLIIQSWKSRESMIDAIQKGYRALLSHGYYLDYLASSISHYKVDPIYEEELQSFDQEQRSRILGGEACMWSEYVSQDTVDSRLWPRALAVAERLWSPSSVVDSKSLYKRLFRMNHLLNKMPTGVTHLSSYRSRLKKLIIDEEKKQELLHPFLILADACEPTGNRGRGGTFRYTSSTPLTTFADVLQSESEPIWRVQNLPMNKKLADIFHTWSLSYIRLKSLFDDISPSDREQVWGQDLEQLSKNLAHVGQIGLRILHYREKKVLHPDKNNAMNTWAYSRWVTYHYEALNDLEEQVAEIRLAAVRPVRQLLDSINKNT